MLPASVLNAHRGRPVFLALVALWGILMLVAAVVRVMARRREHGDYRLFRAIMLRSLIPVYALALILVSLTARPYLRFEERRWVAQDTLVNLPPGGGFTALETRLTERLKAEMTRAAASLQP